MTANILIHKFNTKVPGMFLGAFAIFVLVFTQMKSEILMKAPRDVHAPPPMIQHLSFGYAEVMADLFWLRILQDFDYCDKPLKEKVCQNNSWLFKMLDAITDLAPQFRIPFATGGLALSVLITDVDGATKIFDKSVERFPNDWPIIYRAAYHYLYEVKDNKRAAELLIMAGKKGAPPWVFTLAGRLYSDEGSLELAEHVLRDMIATNQDEAIINRLKEKIESVKANKK